MRAKTVHLPKECTKEKINRGRPPPLTADFKQRSALLSH